MHGLMTTQTEVFHETSISFSSFRLSPPQKEIERVIQLFFRIA